MEDKELDKLFKAEKFNEAIDPPTFAWEALEKDLKRNNRKKRVFVWWILGLLLVSSASYFLFQTKDALNDGYSENPISKNNEFEENLETKNDKSGSDELDIDLFQVDQSTSDSHYADGNLKNAPKSNNPINKKSNSKRKSKLKSNIPSNSAEENKLSNSILDIDQNNSSPLIPYSGILQTPLSSDAENNIDKDHSLFKNSKIENTIYRAIRNEIDLTGISRLTFHLRPYFRGIDNPALSYTKLNTNRNEKRNTIAAYINLGRPNFTNVSIDHESIIAESDWYSFGLGILYQREIARKLHFGGGINYRQSKRKFNYESESLSFEGYEPGTLTRPNPIKYSKLISQGEQRFSFIDLSTSINFEIWSKGVKISMGFAALFNLRLNSHGKALDNEVSIVRYTHSDNLYQSSIGVGISPSITFGVPISQNALLILTPNFTTYFQNLESSSLLRETEYSNFGLNVGVSRFF